MSIAENIQTQLDDGKYSAGVFVDLKKAFDTIDHNILLKKLDYYGVRGIANEWFASYLKNRKQFVSIGGHFKYSGNSNRCSSISPRFQKSVAMVKSKQAFFEC